MDLILSPIVVTGIFSFAGGIIIAGIAYFTQKPKNKADIQSQLTEQLWKEVGRLQEQIDALKQRETASEKKEVELQTIIRKLQADNTRQTFEILQLQKEINELRTKRKQ